MAAQESIAVTQNFVSSVGLRQCLAFLATGNPDLVSGCLQEQRSGLHQRFTAALQEKCPEVRSRLNMNIQDRLPASKSSADTCTSASWQRCK